MPQGASRRALDLYAAIADHLGFRPFHDEWKVMGTPENALRCFARTAFDVLAIGAVLVEK